MAEEEILEQTDEQLQDEALGMGWTPKEQWKGDPARWVDAQEYVKRSHTFVPFLQKAKGDLERSNAQLAAQVSALTVELRAQSASLKAIEESHAADVAEQLKATKAEIGRQLKEAKDEGDSAREVELIEQLTDLKAAEKDAARSAEEAKKPGPAEQKPEPLTPEFLAWKARNPWMDTDAKRARRATLVGQEIWEENVANPAQAKTGTAFYAEVDKRLAEMQGNGASRRPAESKTEGGRPRETNSGGRSYADLPAEAKQACDKLSSKLVGENRAHKDQASWRASYAKQYFETEQP